MRAPTEIDAVFTIAGVELGRAEFAVLALIAFGAIAIIHAGRRAPRDGRRTFTATERAAIFERCGWRCEHKHPLWPRCRTPAEHADHVWPWSRGGLTDIDNGAGLCRKHNLRKGGRIPSRFYRWRLHRRRLRYFPTGITTRPTTARARRAA